MAHAEVGDEGDLVDHGLLDGIGGNAAPLHLILVLDSHEGIALGVKDWNNRSMQDVMPTYRWHVEQEGGNTLKAAVDYSDAYYGGTSVGLNGKAFKDQSSTVTLYSAQLPMTGDLSFPG